MRYIVRLSAFSIFCFFGSPQAQAQPAECGGDYVCIAEAPAATAKLANFTDPNRCPAVPVNVTAASAQERRLVCAAANDALALLGRCAISPRRALHIHITSEVRHPFGGAIFGLFDIGQEKVLVTKEGNIPSLAADTPYAKLPLRDFYRSLIVHEVIHAIMHQNLKRRAATHAAYEYPANALQIESLPLDVREAFLQSFDQTAIKAAAPIFSDPVLFFDPYFFAARAYHHFKASPDGCAHLTALLEGDAAFIAPQM